METTKTLLSLLEYVLYFSYFFGKQGAGRAPSVRNKKETSGFGHRKVKVKDENASTITAVSSRLKMKEM